MILYGDYVSMLCQIRVNKLEILMLQSIAIELINARISIFHY